MQRPSLEEPHLPAVEQQHHAEINYILRGAFDRAVRWRYLSMNPAELVAAPRRGAPSPDPPSTHEAAVLISNAWRDPGWGLNHNRWNPRRPERRATPRRGGHPGVALVNGASCGGGMLLKGPDVQPRYAHRETPELVRIAARSMQKACEAFGVPLAAALQFSLRDPRVTSTIVGVFEPARIATTLELAITPIPDERWTQLDRLARRTRDWLD
jgi:Aldo/keto reductase family